MKIKDLLKEMADDIWYHGSPEEEFDAFDFSKSGSNTGARDAHEVAYFAKREATARAYLGEYDELPDDARSEVDALNKQADEIEAELKVDYPNSDPASDSFDYWEHDALGDDVRYAQMRQLRNRASRTDDQSVVRKQTGHVMKARLIMKDPLVIDWKGEPWDEQKQSRAIHKARAEDYDSVIFKNMQDSGWFGGEGVDDVAAVFYPEQIQKVKA